MSLSMGSVSVSIEADIGQLTNAKNKLEEIKDKKITISADDQLSSSTAEAAEGLASIQDKTVKIDADTTSFTEKIKEAKNAISNIYDKTIGAAYNFASKQAFAADDAATNAAIMGVSYQDYKAMQWMSDQIDVSPETMLTAFRTVKSDLEGYLQLSLDGLTGEELDSAIKANESLNEAWQKSVQYKALGGQYASADEAWAALSTSQITEMYARYIADQAPEMQEALVQQLFGSRGAYLIPMINAMRSGDYDKYKEKYTTGTLYADAASEKTESRLLQLSDAIANAKSAISAFKDVIGSLIAPTFTSAIDKFREALEQGYKIITNKSLTLGEKITQVWELTKSKVGSFVTEFTAIFKEDILPILKEIFTPIGNWLSDVFTDLKVKIIDGLPGFIKLFAGYETEESLAQGIVGAFKTKNNKDGNDYAGYKTPEAYKDKYGEYGISYAMSDVTKRIIDHYEKNYGITNLDSSRVGAGLQVLLNSKNWESWEEFAKAASEYDWLQDIYKKSDTKTKGLKRNGNLKEDSGDSSSQETETSSSEDIASAVASAVSTEMSTVMGEMSGIVSAIEGIEISVGVAVTEGSVTVNCYGATADASKGSTEVGKYSNDKAASKKAAKMVAVK